MYPTDLARVVEVMGGQHVVHLAGGSISDLEHAIAHGLPTEVARNVATSVAPLSSAVRKRVMNMIASPATLKRRKTLSPEASGRAERLARVTALAHQALGDKADGQRWLTEPHMLFGHRPPIDVAGTELGARQVEQMLHNIEYSLPV